ncbi:hypothetical protein DRE_00500 [Drechslerella stenobrocha 248]|uniref:Wbp11/ELF5/Saf1 N-terminal domain-containing protein n=1 Tax=Drechslerella stenobrocha 248 TaxID=1043628 RepID=W7I539_9PEZI|nr:hypothetical protein DRE_00500 [Drechslerella stenobrocha 248]
MPKDRTLNPAAAHLKSEKAKALAKAQKQRLQQRQEKLARRDPDRVQRQVDDLKAKAESGLSLTAHEKRTLEELEKDLKGIRKARETLGAQAAVPEGQRRDPGKREFGAKERSHAGAHWRPRHDKNTGADDDDSGACPQRFCTAATIKLTNLTHLLIDASTASSVANIPLPPGLPPVPQLQIGRNDVGPLAAHLTGLPSKPGAAVAPNSQLQARPVVTTYSSAPVMRDLKKEAAVFMPAAVHRQKKVQAAIDKIKQDAEDLSIDDDHI